MARWVLIGTFLFCACLAINLMIQINQCYEGGSLYVVCPAEPGVGHPLVAMQGIQPLFEPQVRGRDNNLIDPMSESDSRNGLISALEYVVINGINDIFGFFTYGLGLGKFVLNTLGILPYSLPVFLAYWEIPTIITTPIGMILLYIQMLGMYELLSGRRSAD